MRDGRSSVTRTYTIKSTLQRTTNAALRKPGHRKGFVQPFTPQSLQELEQCATSAKDLEIEDAILKSLCYDSMEFRHANIAPAYAETYKWILTPNMTVSNLGKQGAHRLVNFTQWLKDSNEPYWIEGKPGSGKSTLMKLIYNDKETRTLLRTWAADETVVVAGHFFWHRGTDLQRSQQGLLRSLLHKILEETPGLAKELCLLERVNHNGAWTMDHLVSTFEKLGDAQKLKAKFCFFIDGLDEYHGDHLDLIDLLVSLSKLPAFKFCLASRSWPCFEDAFGQCRERRLRLQDLTRNDIENYTRVKLTEVIQRADFAGDEQGFEGIIGNVVQKSQGVFLWVTLVVRSLREGIVNGDSIKILERRLEAFPADLEPFFESLINSVDPTYQEIMAKTFLVVLETTSLPVVTVSFLEEDHDYALQVKQEAFSDDSILGIQKAMRRRVTGRYKGLLECWFDKTTGNDYCRWRIEFLHRTVRDYLMTSAMQAMLKGRIPGSFNAIQMLCRILVAQLKTMTFCKPQDVQMRETNTEIRQVFRDVVLLSRHHQIQTGQCDFDLIDELRRSVRMPLSSYYRSCSNEDFLSVISSKGLSKYVSEYLLRNPGFFSSDLRVSPLLHLIHPSRFLLADFEEGDVEDPQEVLQTVRIFMRAGADPRKISSGKSPWRLIFEWAIGYSAQHPRLREIIPELMDECIQHNAKLVDLFPEDSLEQPDFGLFPEDDLEQQGLGLLKFFIKTLNSNQREMEDNQPITILKKLFISGSHPSEIHPELGTRSLWSWILTEFSNSAEITGPAIETIQLCLQYGADAADTQFLKFLDSKAIKEDEKTLLRETIRNLPTNKKSKKRKRLRRKISDLGPHRGKNNAGTWKE